MTAPDVHTAAREYVDGQITPYAEAWFIDGAVWGAALVTPTREQLVAVIGDADDKFGPPADHVYEVMYGHIADAVLALITGKPST